MVSMVRNTDVDQRDADNAVVIAVTSRAVWLNQSIQSSTEPFGRGAAFPLIQAMQNVNKKLLDKNPRETQLFDVIMLSSDSEDHSQIIASTKHYGLEIGRFCFCSKEETIETLLSNRVNLFLSTDTTDVSTASQRGIVSALLYQQTTDHSSDQLKVLLSGDAVGFSDEDLPTQQCFSEAKLHDFKAAKDSIMRFATLIGEMRKKFALEDSPVSTSLLTVWGSRDTCARALRTLRAGGLMVDEAYCLAGAPRDPILSLVKPHIVFTDGL